MELRKPLKDNPELLTSCFLLFNVEFTTLNCYTYSVMHKDGETTRTSSKDFIKFLCKQVTDPFSSWQPWAGAEAGFMSIKFTVVFCQVKIIIFINHKSKIRSILVCSILVNWHTVQAFWSNQSDSLALSIVRNSYNVYWEPKLHNDYLYTLGRMLISHWEHLNSPTAWEHELHFTLQVK